MTFETRSVLAGAYGSMRRSPGATERAMLTHVVELDADRNEIRVLCHRVKLENIADSYSCTEAELVAASTCPVCSKRDPRRVKAATT